MLVGGHVRMFAPFEVSQLLGVVALDPAGFVDGDRLPAAGGVIFVCQAVFDHLELQGAHRADDFAAVERRGEELCHALVHELVDALASCLNFSGSAFSM